MSTDEDDDLVDLWRRESARAVRRFLAHGRSTGPDTRARRPTGKHRKGSAMKLSARNQLKATVDTVTHGEVMSTVRVTCPTVSTSPRRSPRTQPRRSDSRVGDDVVVIIKSTEVMLAKD